jgi:hypothetical protein
MMSVVSSPDTDAADLSTHETVADPPPSPDRPNADPAGHDQPGRKDEPDRPPRHWSPWLLIRDQPADIGVRPLPLSEVFWASPDIWVDSSDPLGNPVAGEANRVHARVENLGMADAVPVRVDFFWADPSLGLGPANMNHIGSEWVEVKRGEVKDVACSTPWVPVIVNLGHECLLVNCSNYVLDPIIYPFQPTLDRHVGQRNMHVGEASAGETITLSTVINNPFAIPIAMEIVGLTGRISVSKSALAHFGRQGVIRALMRFQDLSTHSPSELRQRFVKDSAEHRAAQRIARYARAVRPQSLPQSSDEIYPVEPGPSLHLRLAETYSLAEGSDGYAFLGDRLMALQKLARDEAIPQTNRFVPLQTLELVAFERRNLEIAIKVPREGKPGEYVVVHLAQRWEQLLIGGYSIAIRVRDGSKRRLAGEPRGR